MTCTCNCLSPFLWRADTSPTVFVTDKHHTGTASGKTSSQVSSESADAFMLKHGRSLGTVTGMAASEALHGYGRQYGKKSKR